MVLIKIILLFALYFFVPVLNFGNALASIVGMDKEIFLVENSTQSTYPDTTSTAAPLTTTQSHQETSQTVTLRSSAHTPLSFPLPSDTFSFPSSSSTPEEQTASTKAVTTDAPTPNPASPLVPSNTGFVIALVCGVCGMIALLVGTGVAGYCLLLSRRAREARARKELRMDLSSRTRSDEQDTAATAEPTFGGSGPGSGPRLNSGTSSVLEPVTKGRGGGTSEEAIGESEYRAGEATGSVNIPMAERGSAIVGRKSRSGADGEGITLTVTKAESYV